MESSGASGRPHARVSPLDADPLRPRTRLGASVLGVGFGVLYLLVIAVLVLATGR